jgi:hypothetical protein
VSKTFDLVAQKKGLTFKFCQTTPLFMSKTFDFETQKKGLTLKKSIVTYDIQLLIHINKMSKPPVEMSFQLGKIFMKMLKPVNKNLSLRLVSITITYFLCLRQKYL